MGTTACEYSTAAARRCQLQGSPAAQGGKDCQLMKRLPKNTLTLGIPAQYQCLQLRYFQEETWDTPIMYLGPRWCKRGGSGAADHFSCLQTSWHSQKNHLGWKRPFRSSSPTVNLTPPIHVLRCPPRLQPCAPARCVSIDLHLGSRQGSCRSGQRDPVTHPAQR